MTTKSVRVGKYKGAEVFTSAPGMWADERLGDFVAVPEWSRLRGCAIAASTARTGPWSGRRGRGTGGALIDVRSVSGEIPDCRAGVPDDSFG